MMSLGVSMAVLLALPQACSLPYGQQETEQKRVTADQIDGVLKDAKVFLLDVREPKELEELGTLEGYVNIPLSQLESRLGQLPKDRPILAA